MLIYVTKRKAHNLNSKGHTLCLKAHMLCLCTFQYACIPLFSQIQTFPLKNTHVPSRGIPKHAQNNYIFKIKIMLRISIYNMNI